MNRSRLTVFLFIATLGTPKLAHADIDTVALANLDPVLLSPSSFSDVRPSFVVPSLPAENPTIEAPAQLHRRQLTDHANRLIQRFRLPLEIAGFSITMRADEDLEIYEGRRPGVGAVLFNAHFWIDDGYFDSEPYLAYALFRASADFFFRRHFDADRCAWFTETQAEPLAAMDILKAVSDTSAGAWMRPAPEKMDERSEEFRQSLDSEGNPVRILRGLVHHALKAVEQRAADVWALAQYQKSFGTSAPGLVGRQVSRRERALAWDFSRAVSAMTLAERLSFRQMLQTVVPDSSAPARVAPATPASPNADDLSNPDNMADLPELAALP